MSDGPTDRAAVRYGDIIEAWDRHRRPAISLGASTIVRTVDKGQDDPEFRARPVGFAAIFEVEPLLWDGDGA